MTAADELETRAGHPKMGLCHAVQVIRLIDSETSFLGKQMLCTFSLLLPTEWSISSPRTKTLSLDTLAQVQKASGVQTMLPSEFHELLGGTNL